MIDYVGGSIENLPLDVVVNIAGPIRLPSRGESATFAPGYEKTAALVFDRVWLPTLERPELLELSFFGHTRAEVAVLAHSLLSAWQSLYSPDFTVIEPGSLMTWSGGPPLADLVAECSLYQAIQTGLDIPLGEVLPTPDSSTPPALASKLFGAFQFPASRVYRHRASFSEEADLSAGDFILASLVELELVRESSLTWEKVLEFRRDKGSRAKLQRMFRWLNRGVVGMTTAQILEEIESRYEQYKLALRKHGIETTLGAFETLLEPKTLFSATALGAAVAAGASAE